MYAGGRSSLSDALAGSLVGIAVLLTVLLIAAAIWLLVKACELVVRVLLAHPRNKALRAAVALAVASPLPVLATGFQDPALGLVVVISCLVLIATAKVVELYHDQLFQRQADRDTFVHDVLHEPWWQAA